MRPVFDWNIGSRKLGLGKRTLIMGVLNVTPDSFSESGLHFDRERALEHALKMLQEGADIIDIGGESTRPGAKVVAPVATGAKQNQVQPAVSEREELDRVIPVISALKQKRPDAVISVDTYKAKVARAAVASGAEIVNDVSGFRWDPQMARTLAELKCGVVLMHARGRPEGWKTLPPASDIVVLVKRELRDWAETAVRAGVKRDRIVLDPGFGFGKNFDENYPLIARFGELQQAGFPLLTGTSRKSFIGRTIGGETGEKNVSPEQRLFGTIATQTALILKGAHIIRAHDVKASLEAARVADAILQAR